MLEQDLQLSMPDGTADAVLFSPDPTRRLPGVLHYTDIGGIREAHRAMARRLAAQGYAVLLPNLFYRTARPPVWDFPRKMGEPKTMQRFAELAGPLSAPAQRNDVSAYLAYLAGRPEVQPERGADRTGQIAAVGYCFGGAMALRTAAASPASVIAAASFHGGNLYKAGDPESPHQALPAVQGRLYFGYATGDDSMTAEDIASFEKALAAWGGRYESETYQGARHGWTVHDNPVFNPPQAERAFSRLVKLFAETLGSTPATTR